jgi:hypothetical protein
MGLDAATSGGRCCRLPQLYVESIAKKKRLWMKPWALESPEAASYGLRREVLAPMETLVFVETLQATSVH